MLIVWSELTLQSISSRYSNIDIKFTFIGIKPVLFRCINKEQRFMRANVFNQYFQSHSPGAFAMALQMLGCREDARDVLQDAGCSLLKQPQLPEQSTEFRMLLFRVVRNKAIDRLRARKVKNCQEFDEQASTEASNEVEQQNPQHYWQQQQTSSQLKKALLRLNDEQREIILLKDWQDFSYAEIAQIIGVETGTVMSRLHRARLKLRELMKQMSPGFEYAD